MEGDHGGAVFVRQGRSAERGKGGMKRYSDYIPDTDRCNHCPLFNYAGEKSYCRFDFQALRKIGEGTTGSIYAPSEQCRVVKVRIYYKA